MLAITKAFLQLLLLVNLLSLMLWPGQLTGENCVSEAISVGYRDFAYSGDEVTSEPTEEKPESKLWWHDGAWWGVLWSTNSGAFRIHRLDLVRQCWKDVGPDIDNRPRSSADALSDGEYLYVASRAKLSHKPQHGSEAARLYRFSYTAGTQDYTLDDGFPVQINESKSKSLVLTKDSSGQLWATWTRNRKVMINRSIGDDSTWGTSFVLPANTDSLSSGDISSVVAFHNNKIGVFWSNQVAKKYYFAIHEDDSPDEQWQAREVALSDTALSSVADDHLNLATSPRSGSVVAAVKTSLRAPGDPLVYLLKRDSTGAWTRHVVGLRIDDLTRPIVLVNSDTDSVYVVVSQEKSAPPIAIVMKSAHLENPVFQEGRGLFFIQSGSIEEINNPTATKQPLNATTNLVVLASDEVTGFYFHTMVELATNTVTVPAARTEPRFQLEQNYPNPFNPATTIKYSLKVSGQVTVTVFDLRGHNVAVLLNEFREAGEHQLRVEASRWGAGVYFYRMRVGNFVKVRKLVLLR